MLGNDNLSGAGVGVRRRELIESTNKQVIMWVAFAAMAITAGMMISVNFIQHIQYSGKVNAALGETESILRDNVENSMKELMANADVLKSNDKLLTMRVRAGEDTVFQVIIDALPMTCDSVATAASVGHIVSLANVSAQDQDGIKVDSCGDEEMTIEIEPVVDETGMAVATNMFEMPTPQPTTFTISVVGSYNGVQELLKQIEKTIRPITINKIEMQGSNDKLQVTIDATTYYIPKVDYQLGSKEIKPE